MKRELSLLTIFLTGLLFLSCASTGGGRMQSSSLTSKSNVINFWIERVGTSDDGIRVKLCFRNRSDRVIRVSQPTNLLTCFPHVLDSLGNDVPQLVYAFPEASEDLKTINVGEIYEMNFYTSIDEYFGLEPGMTYQLSFSYYGRVYDKGNNMIANGDELRSNTLFLVLE